jgi:hypothetical protein
MAVAVMLERLVIQEHKTLVVVVDVAMEVLRQMLVVLAAPA